VAQALEPFEKHTLTEADVHRVRTAVKKARAMLRLVRAPLGKRRYRVQNTMLRDAGRALTGLRDAGVLLKALETLPRAGLGYFDVGRFHRHLHLRRLSAWRQLTRRAALKDARQTLGAVRRRAQHWHVGTHGWSALGRAFERSYERGRVAMRRAQALPSDTNLHEWRKQARYLRYQVQALRPAAPRVLQRLADELGRVSDLLGEDHDLAMLRQAARRVRPIDPALNRFFTCTDHRRSHLRREAEIRGQRVYRRPPGAFAAQLRQHWHSWRI
jgi:CHAD domain-containing protein